MVFTQTIGKIKAKKLRKPNGKKAVNAVMRRNLDIKNAIDASVSVYRPKTNKQRDLARQKAILKAIKRNPAFQSAVRTALILALNK